ncbi:MAG: hypothetical protein M1834_003101 [Cirrosporium novae-zelandiae]|nr:MAG: hypothetical protein M1834_003101 [Cirrosporium novae-zelandiae]
MPPKTTDLNDEPPTSIDPYQILGIESTATADEVKKAYRKQALKYHPDKAKTEDKDEAHKQFQNIAFAYAILSDERRRRRYDTTGNTAESLDLDDDDFNWIDFFREQYSKVVTEAALDNMKNNYQGSEEEKRDLLAAFQKYKGKLNSVYQQIMFANPLEDEDRLREIIDQAIEDEEVEAYDAYINESEASKKRRINKAMKEAKEAEAAHEELKEKGKTSKGKKQKGKTDDMGDLAALIQQRQTSRENNFFDHLEAKYGGNKRASPDEPPEEAFQKTASRKKARKNVDDSPPPVQSNGTKSRRSRRSKA